MKFLEKYKPPKHIPEEINTWIALYPIKEIKFAVKKPSHKKKNKTTKIQAQVASLVNSTNV